MAANNVTTSNSAQAPTRRLQEATSESTQVTLQWAQGSLNQSCDAVCSNLGGTCTETEWPTSLSEFESIATAVGASCADIRAGSWQYNPGQQNPHRYCYWSGRGTDRCQGAIPSMQRFCPCQHIKAQANYYTMMPANTNACTGNTVDISDAGTCEAAATELGHRWRRAGHWPYRTGRCFVAGSGFVWFNTNAGRSYSTDRPICKQAPTRRLEEASLESAHELTSYPLLEPTHELALFV